jgi:hypothetical protein
MRDIRRNGKRDDFISLCYHIVVEKRQISEEMNSEDDYSENNREGEFFLIFNYHVLVYIFSY